MKRTTTFTRGSGCYECRSCGRRTRDDGGGDSVHVRLCWQCYEIAGLENELSDNRSSMTAEEIAQTEAQIKRRQDEIVRLGGKLEQ